jgi:hypothetical protein
MTYTPIQIPPGVVRGNTPAQSTGRFYDANLIRWRSGVLQPIGGNQRITGTPLGSIVRRIDAWTDDANIPRVLFMSDTHIYLLEGSAFTAVQPVDFAGFIPSTGGGYGVFHYGVEDYGDARSVGSIIAMRSPAWWSSTWGQDMLALASSDGRVLQWSPTTPAALFAPVTGAPVNNRAMVVTPERHILLAGAGGSRRQLAWCSREDRNDWNFASTTNTAGFLDTDTRGWHGGLYLVREGTILITDDEVWLVRYVGQPYIFGVERVNDTADVLSPRSVATFNGRAMWMGREAFYLFEGGIVKPVPCDVADYVHGDINYEMARIRAHASSNTSFGEVWFFYPSIGATECDRYVIYNYVENWWSIGAMDRTAMVDASVYPTPIAASSEKHVYRQELGWTDAGASRVGKVWAETGAYSIGVGEQVSKVLLAELDGGSGYDATQVRAYARFTRMGPETAYGPYTPRQDGYTEMRFVGRDLRLRFEATRDEDWGVGVVRLDVRPGGGR